MTGYFPSRAELVALDAFGLPAGSDPNAPQIVPGAVYRSDGLPVDEVLSDLHERRRRAIEEGDTKNDQNLYGLASRTESISDLTERLYVQFAADEASIHHWYPALHEALEQQGTERVFAVPETTIARLPIELAQFIRLEYQQTNAESREFFNQIVFEAMALEDDRTYFIKTGTFSSKFEFANAKCSEPREMGEYFQVINNFAMTVGAGRSIDLCVREYVEAPEGTPTIYHGMPLRVEFRAFVDLDADEVLGITPYWHPSVMHRALAMAEAEGLTHVMGDAQTYQDRLPYLSEEFARHRDAVVEALQRLIPDVDLTGCWSMDVMLEEGDFYLIDMAPMNTSALVDALSIVDEFRLVPLDRINEARTLPAPGYPDDRPGLWESVKTGVKHYPRLTAGNRVGGNEGVSAPITTERADR